MVTASFRARPVTMKLVLVTTPRTWASRIPRFTPVDAPKSSALKMTYLCIALLNTYVLQQALRHLASLEIFFGDGARGFTMPFIIAVDRINRRQRFFDRRKTKQAVACGQYIREAGVL